MGCQKQNKQYDIALFQSKSHENKGGANRRNKHSWPLIMESAGLVEVL